MRSFPRVKAQRRLARFALVGACALLMVPAWAPEAAAQKSAISLVVENDAFAALVPGRARSDREYTHGIWVALERDDAPLWGGVLRRIPPCRSAGSPDASCLETRFEAGQKIFTPDIRAAEPPPTQRPYAGWLYAAATGRVVRRRAARSLRVELGVTGPPSLGEQVHRAMHRISRIGMPLGWEHQLAFEPGIVVRYGERRMFERRGVSGRRVADLILASDVSVGNVSTAVEASALARAGHRIPHPWRAEESGDDVRLFGMVRTRQRWNARELFLDGNTFRPGPGVDRRPFTGALEVGAAAEYRGFRLTYSMIHQGRLYETQPRRHLYGSIKLSYDP